MGIPPNYTYLPVYDDKGNPVTRVNIGRTQSVTDEYDTQTTPTYQDLVNQVQDILGYTDCSVNSGGINRILPLRHQLYSWMFADSVTPMGTGQWTTNTIVTVPTGSNLICTNYPIQPIYRYGVTFSPRDYNSWQNKDIQITSGSFYDKGGTGRTMTYATEWQRFTNFLVNPMNEFISAQQGQMVFRGGTPDGIPFQDSPRMYLPDTMIKFRWYNVPFRFLTSQYSYLVRFVGYINQTNFGYINSSGTLQPWGAGTLLYKGASPIGEARTPPVPSSGLLAYNTGDSFTTSKVVDLELTFHYTARTAGSSFAPSNNNWIAKGHNLLPWLTDRKFYYATSFNPASIADATAWYPTYCSMPFQLLFTDPDLTQYAQTMVL